MFSQFLLLDTNASLSSKKFLDNVYVNGTTRALADTVNHLIFITGTVGMIVNLVTVILCCRLGLKKCSNILITSLAVADLFYLLGIINIPLNVYLTAWKGAGFVTTKDLAFFLFLLYCVSVLLETVGKIVSLLLPVLITFERFVAVFFPLTFSRIVTLNRVRIAILLVYSIGIPVYAYYCLLIKYDYQMDNLLNVSAGVVLMSDDYSDALNLYRAVTEVYIILCGPVCNGLVILGCMALGIKIRLQMRERRKLLGRSKERNAGKARFAKLRTCFTLRCTHTSNCNSTSNGSRALAYAQKIFSTKGSDYLHANSLQENNVKYSESVKDLDSKGNEGLNTVNSNSPAVDNKAKATILLSKTTKILLSICVFYSLTGLFGYFSVMVMKYETLTYGVRVIIHRASILVMSINSGVNFFIYVFFNRNFRKEFQTQFCKCFK
ncbi:G-protein coupled receptor C02B8.5 [Biomphalaria pfeifferi]|uniref:G-protein coupled receptor C02B8.5 n=1 Tax=Biomphalaria pfeifferi TaxID=112525 RepID=A0AAD8B0Z9_BIOPF|nr:G-protein coupled receptor C02B8.5 [Biomphalaria pfeifferi]